MELWWLFVSRTVATQTSITRAAPCGVFMDVLSMNAGLHLSPLRSLLVDQPLHHRLHRRYQQLSQLLQLDALAN